MQKANKHWLVASFSKPQALQRLLATMIHQAYALSSTTEAFNQECTRLRSIFTQLDYPLAKINSTITTTIQSFSLGTREENKEDSNIVQVSLPFIMMLAKRQNIANKLLICFHEMFYRNFLSLYDNKNNSKQQQQ